jgi:hypothetical protein
MPKGTLVLPALGTLGLFACATKLGETMTAMTQEDTNVTVHVTVYGGSPCRQRCNHARVRRRQ